MKSQFVNLSPKFRIFTTVSRVPSALHVYTAVFRTRPDGVYVITTLGGSVFYFFFYAFSARQNARAGALIVVVVKINK